MVLFMIAISTIVITAALQRASVQRTIVEHQIDGYREHHELLGIRDSVENWFNKSDVNSEKLAEFALSGQVAHRIVFDDTIVVLVTVLDGQGAVLRSLEAVEDPKKRRWLAEVLSRIPLDHPELVRRTGPPQVSLRAAPNEVLEAIAAEDEDLLQALTEARDRKVKNATEFMVVTERRGVDGALAQELAKNLAFDPTLWRLNIEAVHPEKISRYTILAEKKGNTGDILEWRIVRDEEAQRTFTQGYE